MIQTTTDPRLKVQSTCNTDVLRGVVIVCACDDGYAMPLTVMLHSAAKNLSAGNYLNVYFLDGGLSESSWIAIKESLVDYPIQITVIEPDYSKVESLQTSHHVTPAAYLRLLTAELMPSHISKAIYLDSDLLVCEDLAELWELPTDDNYCLACPDIACPYIDARLACKNFRRANPFMASHRPIPNYRELGLNGHGEYFNSGVMLLNLDRWRADDVATRMLDCLEENAEHVWCWDQYALNVVFHKQWRRLDTRWNQGAHAIEYPSAGCSPIDRDEFDNMMHDPAIVHFTTEFKPWHYHWMHLRGELFFEALDETSYRGWRPDRPDFDWNEWSLRHWVNFIKWTNISYRKVVSIWA